MGSGIEKAMDFHKFATALHIGPVRVPNRVFLAPMSGVTDVPFRRLAHSLGAGMVISEMVASRSLITEQKDELRKVRRGGEFPFVIQLAGREARWMAEGARIAADKGADIIDINMGCPARKVTNGLSGSALMRDPAHALKLIDATIAAVNLPVTLKMRMGWDHDSLNAPELARRAEHAGVRMITVHGRTRCQFFKGTADWRFVKRVKAAVKVPVIVNGDIGSMKDVHSALVQSGADGVMVGRGCYGRPWLAGRFAAALEDGRTAEAPGRAEKKDIVLRHYEDMLEHHGLEHGLRHARKHLGWYAEEICGAGPEAKHWRGKLCREENPHGVRRHLSDLFDQNIPEAA